MKFLKLATLFFLALGLFASTANAESWAQGAAAATKVNQGGEIDATVKDKNLLKSKAIAQNCAAGSCAQIAGADGKINVGLAFSDVSGKIKATVESQNKSSGNSITQNCAAGACAQIASQ